MGGNFTKAKHRLSLWPNNSTLWYKFSPKKNEHICPSKDTNDNIHVSFVHNSWNSEIVLMFNRRMAGGKMWCIHSTMREKQIPHTHSRPTFRQTTRRRQHSGGPVNAGIPRSLRTVTRHLWASPPNLAPGEPHTALMNPTQLLLQTAFSLPQEKSIIRFLRRKNLQGGNTWYKRHLRSGKWRISSVLSDLMHCFKVKCKNS